jgi:GR25 family glycosyltransferase involved in LPS biosynthesis
MNLREVEGILSSNDESAVTELISECHRNARHHTGYALGQYFLRRKYHSWKDAGTPFLDNYSICCYYSGHQGESFEITTHLLDYRELDPETRTRINDNRHFSIPLVCDRHIEYPSEIVNRILNRAPSASPQVTFSITTCKRTDLFLCTMNSFLQCSDIDLIDQWLCVDDNTAEDERETMRRLYPFFRFIWKGQADKGHARSMNIIRGEVTTPYLFHCEDDWQFFSPKPFLRESIDILESDPSLGQVLVNRNYAEEADGHIITGGTSQHTGSGIQYIRHEYYPPHSRESQQFLMQNPGPTNAYWPHFSLRPSTVRMEAWKRTGDFQEDAAHFEMEYAGRYVDAGFRSCFFNTVYCLHIGRLTREIDDPSKPNAYVMNDQVQFGRAKTQTGTIQVKPLTWWCESKNLCDHYNRQSKGNYTWNNIELTWRDDADYFVIFQCPRQEDFFIPERTIVFQTEAAAEQKPQIWGPQWADPDPGLFLHVRKHRDFPNCPDWHLDLTYLELTSGRNIDKTRTLSAIMSSKYSDPGHIRRIDFLKHYEQQPGVPPIDIYGYDNAQGFVSYRGPLPVFCKDEGLLPYRYTFHAENQFLPNYFTEKLVDAILVETLCFYWGCPNLEDLIDGDAFIRLNLDDPEGSVNRIRQAVENDEWSRRLPAIRRAKHRFLESLQFFPTLERILKEKNIPVHVINLDRRPDRWQRLQQKLQPQWQNFTRFSAVDSRTLILSEEQQKLFAGNDFKSRRGVIACALSHMALWRQLTEDRLHSFYLILEDDVEFSDDFGRKLMDVVAQAGDKHWDLIFLGAQLWRHKREPRLYDRETKQVDLVGLTATQIPFLYEKMIGGAYAYLISREAARRLLVKLESEGLKHAIDYWLMLQFRILNVNFVRPFIAFAEYAYDDEIGRTVDSDIQYDLLPAACDTESTMRVKQDHNPERTFVLIVPSYNNQEWYRTNLDSIFRQSYANYRVIYIDDASTDGTGNLVEAYLQETHQTRRTTLIRNQERVGSLANIYRAVWTCDKDEIVVHVDGDDWLAHENVLIRLNEVYQDPEVWMTYGQFVWHPANVPGVCRQVPLEVIERNEFREYTWVTSHLRSFCAGLFHRIRKEDLLYQGSFFPMAGDVAIIFPLLEMANKHSRFIPEVLYIYNTANQISDSKRDRNLQVRLDREIRSRTKYSPLRHYTEASEQDRTSKKNVYITPGMWGKLFEIHDPVYNIDDQRQPTYQLREQFAQLGYDVRQADSLADLEDPEWIIAFDVPIRELEHAAKYPKEHQVCFLWEPPTVILYNYDKRHHDHFSRVYTWNDDLVDNATYFKFHYPVLHPMIDSELDFDQKQFCTLMASNHTCTHPRELYSERRKMIQFFEQYHSEDFEFYGRGWDPSINPSYRGVVSRKVDTLKRYKFCISYENIKDEPGYVTEKMFDAFRAGCVPVYLGAPNIQQYVPRNCFIDRRDFESEEQLYQFMKHMSKTEYQQMLADIRAFLNSEEAALFSIDHFIQTFKDLILPQPQYFCTAADEPYFECLINLIGSIHKHSFDALGRIAVFDLGLTREQIEELNRIEKVQVYDLEVTHPDLLTRFKAQPWGKSVPGWYAWKPVAIKQALEMFPCFLWIDAGTTVLRPLNNLFDHIRQHGYFFHNGSPRDIRHEATQHVAGQFQLDSPERKWILDAQGLEPGLMGITAALCRDVVEPMYELTKDLRNFEDDGTAPGGFGNARHDLTLFSVLALLANLKIHHHFENHTETVMLDIHGKQSPFHIACVPTARSENTHIYCSRFYVDTAHFKPFIRTKA